MPLRDVLLPRWNRSPGSSLARAGIEPGLYHYLHEAQGAFVRFHLRVDSTGGGLLIAGAAAAARLHPSGVIIAKAVFEGQDDATILRRLAAVFRGMAARDAAADVRQVRAIIETLQLPEDNYPILNLADPAFAPARSPLERPLSADVPLAEPEWLVPILDRLWQLGVPHATIVAGERPDARWLVRAVERAEDLGMIAGVRIRGTELLAGTLLADIVTAGVDHVDVLCLSHEAAVHDALVGAGDHAKAQKALAEIHQREVCPVAEIALVEATLRSLDRTIESLVAREVTNAALFAVAAPSAEDASGVVPAGALVQAAGSVEELAERHGMRLLWYPPVRRDPTKTLTEQIRRGPRTSGDSAIRVEPDGSVIPARGAWQVAGNLLADDWETIRRSPSHEEYRRRVEDDTHCPTCPGLAICAADCPRDPAGWADDREMKKTES